MTATPYSRGIQDINDQLRVLPALEGDSNMFGELESRHWDVNAARELSDLPPCVVLTTPSVVSYFSSLDNNGNRYVLFSGDQKRYFPRKIHFKNVLYDNSCDDMLHELLSKGLLYKKSDNDYNGNLFEETAAGIRAPLTEASVVHQFCSSMKRIDTLLRNMEQEGGFTRLRFEHQEKLTERASSMRRTIAPYLEVDKEGHSDDKIESLITVIREHDTEKVVIFCFYIETARYVAESLEKLLPEKRISHSVDKSDIEDIIRRFAPLANTIDIDIDDSSDYEYEKTEEIDILVATTALAEGFNFQDAAVLINFDLPWTVLILAQRMGRILRPWHEPRDVYIYNMFPSTMSNEKIRHAMNWQYRLLAKNREMKSFSDIPVLVEQHKGKDYEMLELARTVQNFGDADLDLDDVIKFIESADNLQTSSFIDDLAELDDTGVKYLRRLPQGIKSIKKTRVAADSLYILLSYKSSRLYPALFNRDGSMKLNSNRVDEIMHIIRSARDENPATPVIDPAEIDRWIEKSRNEWAIKNNYQSEHLSIVCYMLLVA